MRRIASIALALTIAVTIILLLFLTDRVRDAAALAPPLRLEYFKIYADLAKAIFVGFGAALSGILIPGILAEARYSFDRLKASKTAYSEAKTGVDYLPLRLSAANLKDAALLIQQIHVRKHEVELYPELRRHLKTRGIPGTPKQWGEELYTRLDAARRTLERNAQAWDSSSPSGRLELLNNAVENAVDKARKAGLIYDSKTDFRRLLRRWLVLRWLRAKRLVRRKVGVIKRRGQRHVQGPTQSA